MTGPIGKYRNHVGVELEIVGYHRLVDPKVLGTLYEGVIRDDLFGDRWLIVVPDALAECGYVRLDDPTALPEGEI